MVLFVGRHPCKLVVNASKLLILGVVGLGKAGRSSCRIGRESSIIELEMNKLVISCIILLNFEHHLDLHISAGHGF